MDGHGRLFLALQMTVAIGRDWHSLTDVDLNIFQPFLGVDVRCDIRICSRSDFRRFELEGSNQVLLRLWTTLLHFLGLRLPVHATPTTRMTQGGFSSSPIFSPIRARAVYYILPRTTEARKYHERAREFFSACGFQLFFCPHNIYVECPSPFLRPPVAMTLDFALVERKHCALARSLKKIGAGSFLSHKRSRQRERKERERNALFPS